MNFDKPQENYLNPNVKSNKAPSDGQESNKISQKEKILIQSSTISSKLEQRHLEGKQLDVLISDADGTLYMRQGPSVYIGKNKETAKQIKEKNIPFIINTGKPAWDEHEDHAFSTGISLPLPDAVIAGTGTMIYWRQQNGDLLIDEEYSQKIGKHLISYTEGQIQKNVRFDPELVVKLIVPELKPYIHSRQLHEVLVDQGPVLPDGTLGIEGLRLVAVDLPYTQLKALIKDINNRVSGLKIDFSEAGTHPVEGNFTGWIHVVPSVAGKEKAAEYILSKLHDAMNLGDARLEGHVVGDASNDIRILATGTHPDKDPYTLNQYGLHNLQKYTRDTLEKVTNALSKSNNSGNRRAHLSFLEESGPDGVHKIINSLQ